MWIEKEYQLLENTKRNLARCKNNRERLQSYIGQCSQNETLISLLWIEKEELLIKSIDTIEKIVSQTLEKYRYDYYSSYSELIDWQTKKYKWPWINHKMHKIKEEEKERFKKWDDPIKLLQLAHWHQDRYMLPKAEELNSTNGNTDLYKLYRKRMRNNVILNPERISIETRHYFKLLRDFESYKEASKNTSTITIRRDLSDIHTELSSISPRHNVDWRNKNYWWQVQRIFKGEFKDTVLHYHNKAKEIDDKWFPIYSMDVYKNISEYLDTHNETT